MTVCIVRLTIHLCYKLSWQVLYILRWNGTYLILNDDREHVCSKVKTVSIIMATWLKPNLKTRQMWSQFHFQIRTLVIIKQTNMFRSDLFSSCAVYWLPIRLSLCCKKSIRSWCAFTTLECKSSRVDAALLSIVFESHHLPKRRVRTEVDNVLSLKRSLTWIATLRVEADSDLY